MVSIKRVFLQNYFPGIRLISRECSEKEKKKNWGAELCAPLVNIYYYQSLKL